MVAMLTLGALVVAAVVEVAGDAAIRRGFTGAPRGWIVLGAGLLVAYGVFVNLNRTVDFSRLLGLYIVLFFVVSQLVGRVAFGEQATPGRLLGGALIVTGGAVIQLWREPREPRSRTGFPRWAGRAQWPAR